MTSSTTTSVPWQGDACSLVDAFRAGHSPSAELENTLAAIERSSLNAVCFLDTDAARQAAASADISLPFGGVPIGVKELDAIKGWPDTEASVPLAHRISSYSSTMSERLQTRGGAVLVGQTTSSEFGGVNVTRTVLHGTTRNPWRPDVTPGGSSGGSAAVVAGGILTLATASDGGGSIRIPAGFTGLVGLKSTFGRIPRGPHLEYGNLTVTTGCVARSVRDVARWFDVTNGHHPADPLSLPAVSGWEAGLGTHLGASHGARVAVVADWGGAVVSPAMWERLEVAAAELIADAGWKRVDGVDTSLPRMGAAWSISGMVSIHAALAGQWPECQDVLTPEIAFGLATTANRYSMEARSKMEKRRQELNDKMADLFEQVDLVITATNPDVAFAADGPLPDTFGGVVAGMGNNGLLTFPANLYGNPAISIPAGNLNGLPIGLQVIGRHFTEPLLLDAAWLAERNRPWPLVAPGGPR